MGLLGGPYAFDRVDDVSFCRGEAHPNLDQIKHRLLSLFSHQEDAQLKSVSVERGVKWWMLEMKTCSFWN